MLVFYLITACYFHQFRIALYDVSFLKQTPKLFPCFKMSLLYCENRDRHQKRSINIAWAVTGDARNAKAQLELKLARSINRDSVT